MLRYLAIEAVRLKRTALMYFPLGGLVMAGVFVLLSQGAQLAGVVKGNDGALLWEALYFTGIAGPLMFTMGGLPELREKAARNGGLENRGSHKYMDRLSRLFWLFVISFLFQALNYGFLALFGTYRPVAFWASWIGSLVMIALGNFITRSAGIVTSLIAGILWQIMGTSLAEDALWFLFPPAWVTRVLLNPIGVNINSTPISEVSPAYGESPVLGISLCTVAAVLATLLLFVDGHPLRYTEKIEAERAERIDEESIIGESHFRRKKGAIPFLSVLLALNSWPVYSCIVLSLIMSITLPSDIFTYFILPIGTGLLPILTWPLVSTVFPLMRIENKLWPVTYFISHMGIVVVLSLVTALTGGTFSQLLLWSLTGTTLLFFSFLMLIRFGAGASLTVMILWTIVALTIGGDALAKTQLWIIPFSSWGDIAAGTPREPVALVVSSILLILVSVFLFKTVRKVTR